MTKKQKVVFAVVAVVLVLGIILSYVPGGRSIPQIRGKGSLQPVSGVPFRRYGHRFTGFLLSDP